MTWPTTPAGTTNTDADTDLISLARPDIHQTILNTNAIVDMFNIPSTPTNGYILQYNSSTGKFDVNPPVGDRTVISMIALDNTYIDLSGWQEYNDGFTIEAGSNSNITVGSNGTASTITFPAGSYSLYSEKLFWTYYSGAVQDESLNARFEASTGTLLSVQDLTEVVVSGPTTTKSFSWSGTLTFAQTTTVWIEFDAENIGDIHYYNVPNIQFTKLA